MIAGKNPFSRMTTTSIPVLRRPAASAFVYGTLMAPLTLPCTGPLIISAFVLGSVAGSSAFVSSLAYFLFFGLGFRLATGRPTVVGRTFPTADHPLSERAPPPHRYRVRNSVAGDRRDRRLERLPPNALIPLTQICWRHPACWNRHLDPPGNCCATAASADAVNRRERCSIFARAHGPVSLWRGRRGRRRR